MNIDKKPVDATTAVAKEPLEVTEKDVNEANTLIAEEHYVGKDGDRLFTRDEVSIVLRKRMERYQKSLLDKYKVKDLDELERLVLLGKHMEQAFQEYSSKKNVDALPPHNEKGNLKIEQELLDVLIAIRDKEYISISWIQRNLSKGFPRAGRLFSDLIKLNAVSKEGTKKGNKVNKEVVQSLLAKLKVY